MKKLFFCWAFFFFFGVVLVPHTVSAGGDPHASPTPVPTERFAPPVITGVNPVVHLSEGNQGQANPSGSFLPEGLSLPVLVPAPPYVEIENNQDQNRVELETLEEISCGPAALAAALEILDRDAGRQNPSQHELTTYLASSGLMYEWGTGVEELVLAAIKFGYQGSQPFLDLGFDQLKSMLLQGQPIVVPLGTNGPDLPGHFVTLIGITEDGKGVILQDPSAGQSVLSIEEFVRLWEMQGRAGMIPSLDPVNSLIDQGLPWTGLFSLVALASLVLGHADSFQLNWLTRDLKRLLANPLRKGIGGGPLPPKEPEIETVPEFEYQTVYRGIKTVDVEIPVYETQKVKVGIKEIEKKVPQYTTRREQVGTRKVTKKVPVYSTKKVKIGTRMEKKKIPVTRYKFIQVLTWKKYLVKVPVIRKIGSKKITIGYKNQIRWKRVPVTKKVPFKTTKTIFIDVPVYKQEKYISGYKNLVQEVPTYEEKKVLVGYKMIKETVPVFEERQVQVGTKTVQRKMPWYETIRVPVLDIPDAGETGRGGDRETGSALENLTENNQAADHVTHLEEIEKYVSLWEKLVSRWKESFYDPIQRLINHPDQVLGDIAKLPPIIGLSASSEWNINILSQEGSLIFSDIPSSALRLFYMRQQFDVSQKSVVTINPNAPINYYFTSGTGSIKITKNINYIFGPGDWGIAIKRMDDDLDSDYQLSKHSVSITPAGVSYKWKEEDVFIVNKDSDDDFQIKYVSTKICETKTMRTEGIIFSVIAVILLVKGAIWLASGLDLYQSLDELLGVSR